MGETIVDKKLSISRRSMMATGTAGLGLLLAGLTGSEAEADCKKCGPKAKKCPKTLDRSQYHHIGVPTQVKHKNERYLEDAKVYITDPEKHPYRIEWCRFAKDSEAPKELQTTAHIAFEVKCVDSEMKKYTKEETFLEPFVPYEGVKVAFIKHEGLLVEFFQKTK